MSESKIRELAEAYIGEAVAESEGSPSADQREAAIERVAAASRKLASATKSAA
jgi:hypothetical protein